MNIHVSHRLTAEEFIQWAEKQPNGRYELHDGAIVQMSAERSRHSLVKGRVFTHLDRMLRLSALVGQVYPDGMAIKTGRAKVYEPDCFVRLGEPLPDDALLVLDPVIVVEVLSPTTRRSDILVKLPDYFTIPELHHVIIVDPEPRTVEHHVRTGTGIEINSFAEGGHLPLVPPGLTLDTAAFWA